MIAEGKNKLSRLLAIANGLHIPAFVVFDADGRETRRGAEKKNRRDNSCILKLCSCKNFDPVPSETLWRRNVVMWSTCISEVVRGDVGADVWGEAEQKARVENGLEEGINAKNCLLIAATLEELWRQSRRSGTLDKLTDSILKFATWEAQG